VPVQVITFAHREQGFYVAPGNPLGVQSYDDLPRVRYVNRQRGAGTRVLLDYELERRGIPASSVRGYDHEEYTHLAVAVSVASGIADCGMGVRSGAIAMKLDFPVGWERSTWSFRLNTWRIPACSTCWRSQRSRFSRELAAQPGYDTREAGRVQYVTSEREPSPEGLSDNCLRSAQ
jgi:putative molybdopterin biosynthesis protein